MKDYKLLFVLGVIIFVFPFLGFPEFFRTLVIVLSGLILIVYSIYIRSIYKKSLGSSRVSSTFVESSGYIEEPNMEIKEEILEEGELFEQNITKY